MGEIHLEWDELTSDVEPDQQLVVYTAERGSRSEQVLRELGQWATDQIRPVSLDSAASTVKRSPSS